MTTTEIAVRPVEGEWSVERIVEQTLKIQQCMSAVMRVDEHYGVIPGTKGRDGKPAKPTLLKAGAEKLCLMFRFDPEYEVVTSSETPALFSYTIRCILWHIPTGARVASGLGSCNSREKKYVRAAPKKCPQCGKEAIIKGQEQYGGGWLCWKKKDGCGAKFIDGAEEIEKQESGVEDPSDLSNTILKMACKRALVAAVLNGTAASDCFTQDLEDLTEKAAEYAPPKASADPSPKAETSRGTAPTTTTGSPASTSSTKDTKPKGTGAADIIHDGTLATPKQITLLHTLKSKLGVQECDGSCVRDAVKVTKRKGNVPITVRCVYHTQLAKFTNQAGEPITTSKDLAEPQMSYLLDRYQEKVAKMGVKMDGMRPMDLGDIIPPQQAVPDILPAKIRETRIHDAELREYILAPYGADTINDLRDEDKPAVAGLLMAWGNGQEAYGREMVRLGFRSADNDHIPF